MRPDLLLRSVNEYRRSGHNGWSDANYYGGWQPDLDLFTKATDKSKVMTVDPDQILNHSRVVQIPMFKAKEEQNMKTELEPELELELEEEPLSLPQDLFPMEQLDDVLKKADYWLSQGDTTTAFRLYRSVSSHIEKACNDEQKSNSIMMGIAGAGIGLVLGHFLPHLRLITMGVGAYLAYKASQNATYETLAQTPYYDIYERSLSGTRNSFIRARKSAHTHLHAHA